MENLKNVMFYVLGVAGLVVVSVVFTGGIEADISPLPTNTPAVRNTPTSALSEADQAGCRPTPPGSSFSYLPGAPLTNTLVSPDIKGQRLVISGTVYASDCVTPLPGVFIEVWQNDGGGNGPAPAAPLRAQMQTGARGKYEFTTIKPGSSRSWPAHIHYRVTFPDGFNALTTVIFFDDVFDNPDVPAVDAAAVIPLAYTESQAGPLLRGTFDIVLPVEAPPAANQSACTDSPAATGAHHYIADVPFTTSLAPPGIGGTRLAISGTVFTADRRPLPGALLEVWHADDNGLYDQAWPFPFRARLRTDDAGRFEFRTIKPGHIQAGCEALPAHINYLVSYADYQGLFITQFFADDPYLPAFTLPARRTVITSLADVRKAGDPVFWGHFEIVLPIRLSNPTPTVSAGPWE